MLRLVAISDTHTHHQQLKVPDGDVFAHLGDYSKEGTAAETKSFLEWMSALPHKHKLLVVGNHDRKSFFNFTEPMLDCSYFEQYPGISFLIHSGLTIEGVRFYGCASMRMSKANPIRYGNPISEAPQTDVLLTHNAPKGILDQIVVESEFGMGVQNIGDQEVADFVRKNPPKVHVFGHIHAQHGYTKIGGTQFWNVAACDDKNILVHGCVEIDIPVVQETERSSNEEKESRSPNSSA